MADADLLPCDCPVEGNLFETEAGPRVLITLRPMWDGERLLMSGKVWCTDHGWVKAEDLEYDRLAAVVA